MQMEAAPSNAETVFVASGYICNNAQRHPQASSNWLVLPVP